MLVSPRPPPTSASNNPKRAAEIETLKAQAEVQPLISLASQLSELKGTGEGALHAYVRNVRLGLFGNAHQVVVETKQ
jgi:hypothetical protein